MRTGKWGSAFLTAMLLGGLRLSAQMPDTRPPVPDEELPEVLSRGPVHEAFAGPLAIEHQPGVIAPRPPPAHINETPPAEKPQGEYFVWIPGYWAWDADRTDYIWVSACWRAAPPDRSWIPGYWAQVPRGWEWVSGYWAPAGVRDIEYLPPPPAITDLEPDSLQPSPDMIWVQPCMYWQTGRYIRRHGYWLRAPPDWMWVPSHYVVTPRGYIFAGGHWDYSIDRRGVLFAPVYFPPAVCHRPGYTFTPGIIINTGSLRTSLFTYPRYGHYYFGDYYDTAYLHRGIFPWVESRNYSHHIWYDPIFEHAHWRHHHSNPHWADHELEEYRRRCNDKELRPAHTFREQESRLAKLPEPQRHTLQVALPLETAIAHKTTPLKFAPIDNHAWKKISREANDAHIFREERTRWESPSAGGAKTIRPAEEWIPSLNPDSGNRQTPRTARPDMKTVPVREPQIEPNPFREIKIQFPERIQGPSAPASGNTGPQGVFQKGPSILHFQTDDTK